MDQIVFVIDLESFLPPILEDDFDDGCMEAFLTDVKKAVLRILTYGRIVERRRDLSSFGFRYVLLIKDSFLRTKVKPVEIILYFNT